MKRIITLIVATTALVAGVVGATSVRAASSFQSPQNNGNVTLAKNDTYNGAYYATGQNIVIDGTINGDLYCGARTVEINGEVNGDVICGAQTILVNGTIAHDARVMAQTVTLSGTIMGTLSAMAQSVMVSSTAHIGSDLNGGAQFLAIRGAIDGDLTFSAQTISGDGLVKGDASVQVQSLELSGAPSVQGKLTYSASEDLSLDNSVATGGITYNQSKTSEEANPVLMALVSLVALIACAVVVALFAPRYLERTYRESRKLSTILVGMAVVFGGPFVVVMAAVSIVLLPLAIAAGLAGAVLMILSIFVVSYQLGRAIFGSVVRNIPLLALAGATLLGILLMIPYVGMVALFAAMVVGVGSLVVTITQGYRRPNYKIPTTSARKK